MGRRELHYFDLLDYQLRAIEHVKSVERCALWVDMGLGKTAITLTAVQSLRESFDVNRTLVVAPLRVARKTWTDEIKRWSHLDLTASYCGGPNQAARFNGLRTDANIHLINRENLPWLRDLFVDTSVRPHRQIRRWPWDTVILDESTSFKSHDSQRTEAASHLLRYADRVIELTGLPAPNGVHDLWSPMKLLDNGRRLGHTITDFRRRWCEWDVYKMRWLMKEGAEAQIMARCGDIAMSLRAEDYLELPPILDNMIPVTMNTEEMGRYEYMERQYALELKGKTITAVNGGVLYGKLLQLANGAVYEDGGTGKYEIFHDRKAEAFADLVETLKPPVMCVYNFKHDLDRMIAILKKAGANWRLLKTEKDEDDWNEGKIDWLLLHPASGGHGLNLQFSESGDMVFYGHQSNLELYKQIIARLGGGHRRQRPLTLHHIYTENTKEVVAMESIEEKDETNERVMNAVKLLVRNA